MVEKWFTHIVYNEHTAEPPIQEPLQAAIPAPICHKHMTAASGRFGDHVYLISLVFFYANYA